MIYSHPLSASTPFNGAKGKKNQKDDPSLSEQEPTWEKPKKIGNRIGEQFIDRFYPHITSRAGTLPQYKVSFETLAGVSAYTSVFFNSLNFGLIPRLQIGISPFLFLTDEHDYNFNLKWNFYRGKKVNWAIHYSKFNFGLNNEILVGKSDGSTTRVNKLNFQTWGVLVNFFPNDPDFRAGFNFNFFSIETEDAAVNKDLKKESRPMELMADFDMTLNDRFHLTFGVGRTRSSPFDAFRKSLPFGWGLTLTHVKKQGILKPIALGTHYIPSSRELNFLLSIGIDLH